MRKMLAPAFSQRSLLEQESIIGGVIDRFVRIIGEKAGPGSNGINMTKWYEMGSFDILGEMAFGESFYSLEAGKLYFLRCWRISRVFDDITPSTILLLTFLPQGNCTFGERS